MLSHVHLGVTDFGRAFKFYSGVLPLLGWRLRFVDEQRPWAGWRPAAAERPLFLIGRPYDGRPHLAGNGQMIALLADSRPAVIAAYEEALMQGGTCEGPPGLRPEYHPDYFGAYVRDPEGNKLCVCCHAPSAGHDAGRP